MKFSLIYFIRLFQKHLLLIAIVPVVAVAVVFFLTRGEQRSYVSKTTVFTSLASGNSVDVSVSGFMLNTVNTQFDNLMGIIKSNATLEKTGLSLFTGQLMLEKPDPKIMLPEHYEEFKKNLPAEVKKLVVKGDFEKTLAAVRKFYDATDDNYVRKQVADGSTWYNPGAILSKLSVRRVQNSDNIELSYESNDPGVCQQTLICLVKVYKQAYIVQKAGQSDNAVAYFESEVARAAEQLEKAENELLEFNKLNKIINYNEQSKFIAGRKEQFEMGYQEMLKQNASAGAVIELMDKKMSPAIRRKLQSSELISLRKELNKVNLEMAAMQSLEQEDGTPESNQGKFGQLSRRSFDLKNQMKGVVDSVYAMTNGTTGVPEKNLITDWLSAVIEFEGTSAQIATMDRLRTEFDKIYSEYAPMGAMMRRMERKINVAEDEYMSLVKNLGLAKLKQQSVEVSSANTILDPPPFPSQPQPGKRKILILAGGVISMILTLLLILVADLLDTSLRNATRTAAVKGLEVESIFPLLRRRKKKGKEKVDTDYLERKSIEAISRKLLLQSIKVNHGTGPVSCIAFSTLENEGKSFLLQRIAAQMAVMGYRVLLLCPHEMTGEPLPGVDTAQYTVSKDFYLIRDLRGLETPGMTPAWDEYHFIFAEFPGILDSSFPVNLFKTADNSFLVCRASRTWSKADASILAEVLAVTDPVKPRVLLNGVALEEMETLVGELPRKRSKIRIAVKKFLTGQFRNQNVF